MSKWNLIVDVANCTNCNLCALALQDEHVGNAFPGYAEEMPKHGHRWIEIKRRERGTPPVVNAPEMAELGREAARAVPDVTGVRELHTVNMGGEDFGFYLGEVPGCYIRVGSRVEGCESYPAHSSRFDVDEDALAAGAAWFVEIARRAGARLDGGGA